MNKIALNFGLLPACFSMILTGYAQPFTTPLHIPDTMTGPGFNLTMQQGTWQFYPGVNTGTYAYNGNILGPTLIMNAGDSVFLNVTNNLPDPTSTHWHGFHVPANVDGTHYNTISPGTTWRPSFEVLNKAATYWYHPHLYGSTNLHVSKGLSGLIIVRDAEEASKSLPRTYGVDDFPIIIQSKIINALGQIRIEGPFDSTMVVNGVVRPYLDVPAQPVRFRMLNGASRRVFMMGLSDSLPFYQVATDGSLTEQPRELDRVMLSNGERSEIVVDFTGLEDSVFYLMNYGTELGPFIPGGATGGGGGGANPYDSADFELMQINVVAPTPNPVAFNPNETLTTIVPWDPLDADTTRTITFNGGLGTPFILDDTVFRHDLINQVIPVGNIEVWNLVNTTFLAHPFHIHDVQFIILDKDGLPPPPAEQGLKDVVLVEGFSSARFITQFTDFTDPDTAYMYHCHNLAHEDSGMMAQFVVVDTTMVGIEQVNAENSITIYPNPSSNTVTINLEEAHARTVVRLFNSVGMLVREKRFDKPHQSISLSVQDMSMGTYYLSICNSAGVILGTCKVVKAE